MDNNGDGFYVIQGRAKSSLNEDETVKLGFGAYITTTETYKLELVKREGEYLTSNPIYVKDNMLNIVHDLTSEAYTFTSEGGTFDERFEIVFKNQSLSTDDSGLSENELTVFELENGDVRFLLKNKSQSISNISLYDLQGRLVYNLVGNSHSETFNISSLKHQVFIAKVTINDGQIITKKFTY